MSDDNQNESSVQAEVLERTLFLLAPIVRLLIQHGVDHPRFASAMKRVFIDEAEADLAHRGEKVTHTALSLLAGLQRRDIKALRERGTLPRKAKAPTLPMQAVARWSSDPRFLAGDGTPLPLPLRATDPEQPTFEQLSDMVSKDVHPPALLAELVRQGLVVRDGELARLSRELFVTPEDIAQLLGGMADNLRDHAEAAVANVLQRDGRFLEFSTFADELRPESADELQALVRSQMRSMNKKLIGAALTRVERDKALGYSADAPETRIRFGAYFYSEPVQGPPPPAEPADGDDEGESEEQ